MTTWVVPRDWTDGEVVGAVTANIHWRDNLKHLKDPPFAQIVTAYTAGAVISATSTTAVPITAGISATLLTYGGNVQAFFQARVTSNAAVASVFNLQYNGTAYTTQVSGIVYAIGNTNTFVSYHVWVTGLASGSYTFVPTWAQPAGAAQRIDASSNPLIFWIKEG